MAPLTGSERVVVVGQGYVGLTVAVRAVEVGFTVVGLEVDMARLTQLAEGRSYVRDIPDPVLAAALGSGRYSVSGDPSAGRGFDVAVITVPTPLREGRPDLTFVETAARTLGRHLRPGATVVVTSSTYPGTTEEVVKPLLEHESGLRAGHDFFLGYSPERIDPGNAEYGLVNTPKVVSGIDAGSLRHVQAFFDTLVDKTIPVSGCREAELAKLIESTFRHVNVALANELAIHAEALGVDFREAMEAASSKPFGFLPFAPGPGVGGHCLPTDPSYLAWRVQELNGHPFRFVRLANDINGGMPRYVVNRIDRLLGGSGQPVAGARILLLGLAYKRNTGDWRESPALVLADLLAAAGAEVRASDPLVDPACEGRFVRVDCSAAELALADLVVLVTDHDAFDYDLVTRHARLILDTRDRVGKHGNVEHL